MCCVTRKALISAYTTFIFYNVQHVQLSQKPYARFLDIAKFSNRNEKKRDMLDKETTQIVTVKLAVKQNIHYRCNCLR